MSEDEQPFTVGDMDLAFRSGLAGGMIFGLLVGFVFAVAMLP